ncbi:fatty acid desaturase [Mongoliimonas terrestris]|uniref:fatty acid desaturase n=1 Tax=Mongoliimonas terrestris TaxID=1709001 RepID=UPI00094956F0|nr:fatty acid desaturase [Mongoliimonas terrestris]
MDEVFARRDMIMRDTLRDLSSKSDLRGAVQVVSHLGAILSTGVLLTLTWGSWWVVPVFIVHGVLLNFLYAGQHEFSHATVFSSKLLNEWFGRLFGFVLLYPRDFDQIQHFAHHRFTQNWEKDGELARPPYDFKSYLLWVLGPTYWYTRIRRILRFSAGVVSEPYIPERRKADVIREGRLHLLGYGAIAAVSVATGSWLAVTHWLAPMMVTKVVHQLQNTIEHLGLPHVDDITLNTRSTRTNGVMRWLAWNMQYHTAHHAFPGVPCYNLARLHRSIFTDRGRRPEEMTYLGFQWKAIRAFLSGRTEADYPSDRVWISDDVDLEPVAPADNVRNPLGLKLED